MYMLDQKIFGEKLRNHRKKLGMTQEEVAEKVGVSPQAISKWEAGDCLPDCFNLKAIADVYKISADVLLETESDINNGLYIGWEWHCGWREQYIYNDLKGREQIVKES